jgi:hypothetical protein
MDNPMRLSLRDLIHKQWQPDLGTGRLEKIGGRE